ncbi:MAG: M23 family metallopeptidase [Bacteroidales bacterium]|nr:M23 family metallopeptidase [Bacteroidales bacterium]
MSKQKYKLNPHSLEYELVRLGKSGILKRMVSYLFGSVVFAALVLFIAYSIFSSPKELMQDRELEQYAMQYEIMNERLSRLTKVLEDIEDRDDNIYRTIFEAEPIPNERRKAGVGGVDRYSAYKGYENSTTIINTAKKLDQLSRELYIQSTSFDDVYKMAKDKARMLASIPAIQPVANKDLRRIASGYGYRIHPIYKTLRMHEGIDFSAPTGTPIYATGDGEVERLKGKMSGYGKVLIIDHGFGYESLYAHMSKIFVKPGEKVKRGQIIGYVGNTGRSTGPHLHYEIRKNGKPVNPVHFFFQDLTPEEYEKVIEISSRPTQSMS